MSIGRFSFGYFKVVFLLLIFFTIKGYSGNNISSEQLYKFSDAVSIIKSAYVENIDDNQVVESAIDGILTSLDPHSEYLDREEMDNLNQSMEGEFGGLGIQIVLERGVIKVISPMDDTPAKKAGIQAGDLIVKVNGQLVEGQNLSEIINQLKGEKGTVIELTIIREGEKVPLEFNIVRDIIKVPNIKTKVYDKYYGYIRIAGFQDKTEADLKLSIDKLSKETKGDLRGIVLDLRNNPGGLLTAAIDVSDVFLDMNAIDKNRVIVSTKGRAYNSDWHAKSTTSDYTHSIPLVLLVNSGSASASEIVAGAMQDHNRAIILGEKTFGKGSVQSVIPLGNSAGIKLTTARYYTPSGVEIQAKGISPDILIEHVNITYDKQRDVQKKLFDIREKDINNFIEPLSKSEMVSRYSINKETKEPLLYTDIQLYGAINILKALSHKDISN